MKGSNLMENEHVGDFDADRWIMGFKIIRCEDMSSSYLAHERVLWQASLNKGTKCWFPLKSEKFLIKCSEDKCGRFLQNIGIYLWNPGASNASR
jgi:hypothetical protein